MKRPLGYLVLFFAIFVALYAAYKLADPYLIHYYRALASSVCFVLGHFDPAVACEGNYILYGGARSLVVVEGCDGITFVALILAAVLPFSAPWRMRLVGLLTLIPALLVLNWVRLLVLAEVRFYMPQHFDFVHVYLFQPVMIFVTLAAFALWMIYSERQGATR